MMDILLTRGKLDCGFRCFLIGTPGISRKNTGHDLLVSTIADAVAARADGPELRRQQSRHHAPRAVENKQAYQESQSGIAPGSFIARFDAFERIHLSARRSQQS
jgi:hypothetical protein